MIFGKNNGSNIRKRKTTTTIDQNIYVCATIILLAIHYFFREIDFTEKKALTYDLKAKNKLLKRSAYLLKMEGPLS